MRIEGKTALITGGSSGLGAASARMIAAAGGHPIAVDLKPGDAAIAFAQADVTRPDQMQEAVDYAIERFGALHILINCAGVAPAARVAQQIIENPYLNGSTIRLDGSIRMPPK